MSSDYYDNSYNQHQQGYSGRYEKSSNSESGRYSATGPKPAFDDNKYGKTAQSFRSNGFKQMRNQMSHRSNEQ